MGMLSGKFTLGRLVGAIRKRGVVATAGLIAEFAFGPIFPRAALRDFQHWFIDKKYGINTWRREDVDTLGVDGESATLSYYYDSIYERQFRMCLRPLPKDLSSYVFMDIGSGKGRLLIFAAQYNFKSILGLEFSPRLVEEAVGNIRSYTRRHQTKEGLIRSQQGDAAELELLDGTNYVLFLANPFQEGMTRKFAARLDAWRQRNPSNDLYAIWWNCRPERRDVNPLFERDWLVPVGGISTPEEQVHGRRYVVFRSRSADSHDNIK